jgi:hypothetical protein
MQHSQRSDNYKSKNRQDDHGTAEAETNEHQGSLLLGPNAIALLNYQV